MYLYWCMVKVYRMRLMAFERRRNTAFSLVSKLEDLKVLCICMCHSLIICPQENVTDFFNWRTTLSFLKQDNLNHHSKNSLLSRERGGKKKQKNWIPHPWKYIKHKFRKLRASLNGSTPCPENIVHQEILQAI